MLLSGHLEFGVAFLVEFDCANKVIMELAFGDEVEQRLHFTFSNCFKVDVDKMEGIVHSWRATGIGQYSILLFNLQKIECLQNQLGLLRHQQLVILVVGELFPVSDEVLCLVSSSQGLHFPLNLLNNLKLKGFKSNLLQLEVLSVGGNPLIIIHVVNGHLWLFIRLISILFFILTFDFRIRISFHFFKGFVGFYTLRIILDFKVM